MSREKEVLNNENSAEIKKIGEIPFLDVIVSVYHDKYTADPNAPYCCWRSRNPDSFYQGPVFMSHTGKIEYPEDAIIPDQTEEDREIIPIFIMTSRTELDDYFIEKVVSYMTKEHKRRNRIYE